MAIDVKSVTEVLLADGWHHVRNQSFGLDAYEYRESYGSTVYDRAAFRFQIDGGASIAGPLSSILAVKIKDR